MQDHNNDTPIVTLDDDDKAIHIMDNTEGEILHVAADGHVQVEIAPMHYEIGCSPDDKIQQVIEQDRWDEFYKFAKDQSDEWLINTAVLLAENNKCPTCRLLELVLMAQSTLAKVAVYQLCKPREWSKKEFAYQGPLLHQFTHITALSGPFSELDVLNNVDECAQVIEHLRSITEY